MMRSQKCRSKDRNPNGGGCCDPQCPEGPQQGIESRMVAAVRKGDLNSYIEAKEAQEATNPASEHPMGLPTKPVRGIALPGASPKERVEKIDKTHIPSYGDVVSMMKGLNGLYREYGRKYGSVSLYLKESGDLKMIEVLDMNVMKEVRGMGVGKHMRKTILKFAEENNCLVSGTPTPVGDGSLNSDEEGYSEHILSHRKRLEQSYLNSGYEYNYAYKIEYDVLTHEPLPQNPEWKKQFSPQALGILLDAGQYIKWPNNTIPDNWKA